MKYITRTVWILSLISLFTDMASEMLYPIMPIYLKSIGFSVVIIGLLEGFAEAVAGLSKGYFGKWSDYSGKRVPFVQLGYALSSLSKPLMAFIIHPVGVFMIRTLDRLGKGIRTGARDAILSDEATPQTKGKVFGFHRSMDTMGAVLGPLMALLYLFYFPEDYKTLFLLAFAPGVLSVVASLLLKSKPAIAHINQAPPSFFAFMGYWKTAPVKYKKLVIGLLLFTLFNSSDAFLLLRLKDSGISDSGVIGVYIFYNLVYAVFAFPMGIIADKLGLSKVFILGLIIFSAVYFGMAFANSLPVYLVLFFCYGVYAAATEGVSKAWISNITDKNETATAIGTYSGFMSICAMLANSLAGLVWYNFGASATFICTGVMTVVVVVYFVVVVGEGAKE